MRLIKACMGVLALFLVMAGAARAQTTGAPIAPQSANGVGDDSDPTRPVVWSLRNEYFNFTGDRWNNAFIVRRDHAFLASRPQIAGKRGFLTRIDIPFVTSASPDKTVFGLGDVYGQLLLVPHLTRQFAFVGGTGVSVPSATDRTLTTGKLTVSPVVAPVWFFPKRGLFFIKAQDFISVAGDDDRPGLHYLTVTPLLIWRIQKPYWIQVDGEAKVNWKAQNHVGYKAGFLLGRMTKKRFGVWIKAEAGLGEYRDMDYAVKASIFKVR